MDPITRPGKSTRYFRASKMCLKLKYKACSLSSEEHLFVTRAFRRSVKKARAGKDGNGKGGTRSLRGLVPCALTISYSCLLSFQVGASEEERDEWTIFLIKAGAKSTVTVHSPQSSNETHFFFLLGVTFKPVGCFKDERNRAMPQLLKNFRTIPGGIDWFDLSKVVRKCADEAMNRRKS